MNDKLTTSNQPSSPNSVVSGKVRSTRWLLFMKRHKLLLITGAFWLIVIGGAVTVWLLMGRQHNDPVVTESERIGHMESTVEAVNATASNLTASNNITDAALAYDNAINQTDDLELKDYLLANKATMYFNNEMYNEALAIEQDILTRIQTDGVYYTIAQIYQAMGDNAKAVESFRLAVANVDPDNPMADSDIDFYNSQIELLSAGTN